MHPVELLMYLIEDMLSDDPSPRSVNRERYATIRKSLATCTALGNPAPDTGDLSQTPFVANGDKIEFPIVEKVRSKTVFSNPASPHVDGPMSDDDNSEYYTDASSASESCKAPSEGKRKRRKTKLHPKVSKAKKVATSAAPARPSTSADVQPTPATASQRPRRPARSPTPRSRSRSPLPTLVNTSPKSSRAPSPAPITKKQKVPPIFIHEKSKWTDLSKVCVERKINFLSATSCQAGIKVSVQTPTDFRNLTRLLKTQRTPFHTYTLPSEAPVRVVIRRIPKEISAEDIFEDLVAQKVPVMAVHRMRKARGGQAYDMVSVECDPAESYNPIFKIKSLCSLSGISIEKPYRPTVVGQCHNCQQYGHSQKNCFGVPRCVKCRGDHSTRECPRPKNPADCTEPPSCVLCDQVGHTANFKGCPKAPKLAPKMAKRHAERQAYLAPSGQPPARLAPQRTSPWGKLNHQKVAPQTVHKPPGPMEIPTPSPKAPTVPMPAQNRQVAPTTVAAKSLPQSESVDRRCVADVIIGAYKIWMTDEARSLAAEIRRIEAAGDMPAPESQDLFKRYPNITEELDNLVYRNGQWVRI